MTSNTATEQFGVIGISCSDCSSVNPGSESGSEGGRKMCLTSTWEVSSTMRCLMKRVCGCQNSALSFCIRVCVCSANHQVSRFFINDPEETYSNCDHSKSIQNGQLSMGDCHQTWIALRRACSGVEGLTEHAWRAKMNCKYCHCPNAVSGNSKQCNCLF